MTPPPCLRLTGLTYLHAAGIDRHHFLPLVNRHFLDRLADVDARVVDQHVHTAGFLHGVVNRALPVLLAGHVDSLEVGLRAALGKLGHQLLILVTVHVQNDDRCPVGSQQARHRRAQTASAAGNQNCFFRDVQVLFPP